MNKWLSLYIMKSYFRLRRGSLLHDHYLFVVPDRVILSRNQRISTGNRRKQKRAPFSLGDQFICHWVFWEFELSRAKFTIIRKIFPNDICVKTIWASWAYMRCYHSRNMFLGSCKNVAFHFRKYYPMLNLRLIYYKTKPAHDVV